MKTVILACYHKPGNYISADGYLPVQMGKAVSCHDLGITGDDTGDNISELNPYFCELTGIYWAWKNLKDVQYIGLCHYRRVFDFKASFFAPYNRTKEDFDKIDLSLPDFDKIFGNHDVIVPYPFYLKHSVVYQYCVAHNSEDLRICRNIIDKKYPEYIPAFNKVLSKNRFFGANMMIMRKHDFDKYCEWLFDILFELKDRIKFECYPDYQKRVFGFLSERLFTVYITHNKLRVKYANMAFSDESLKISKTRKLYDKIRKPFSFLRYYLIYLSSHTSRHPL